MFRRITLALCLLIVANVSIAFAATQGTPSSMTISNPVYIPIIRKEVPPTPPPPPPPNAVTVKSSRTYIQNDTRYLVGEVVNTTASKVFDVRIRASFFNAANELVATQDAYAEATGVAPGADSPFISPVIGGNQPNLRYELTVTYAASPTYNYRSLTVVSQESRILSGPQIYGQVRNDNAEILVGTMVYVTFYDAVGNVVDVVGGSTQSNRMTPGQAVGYSVDSYYSIDFATYTVIANGRVGQ